MKDLKFASGKDVNFSNKSAKGKFTLHGAPAVKIEKAYTIIEFPGGGIEITRTSDNQYWVHVTVNHPEALAFDAKPGQIVDARIDVHNDHASLERAAPLLDPAINHLAILIKS